MSKPRICGWEYIQGFEAMYETLATKADARKGRARSSHMSLLRLRRYVVPPTTTETEGCLANESKIV